MVRRGEKKRVFFLVLKYLKCEEGEKGAGEVFFWR